MKKFITVTLLLAVMSVFATSSYAFDRKKEVLQEITFNVSIDCANCAKKLQENLPFEKGIKDLKVVLDDQTVWVKYSAGKTNKEKLASAIEKLGFEVKGVKKETENK